MGFLRIRGAVALEGFGLRLTLTDGSVIERDVSPFLVGPVFRAVRSDPGVFRQVRVEAGAVTWPNGADLCPDVLIWNGPPPSGRPGARRPRAKGAHAHRGDRRAARRG